MAKKISEIGLKKRLLMQIDKELNIKKKKYENTTTYVKNRQNSSKLKGFSSRQTLCLTESFVLRNRQLLVAANRQTV